MSETVRQPTIFDSGQEHVGVVYAKALLGAAGTAGQTAAVVEELDSFVADVLDRLPVLEATLASPRVPMETKLALLERGLAGRMSETLLNFLKVVCRHQRFDCLRAVRRAAGQLWNEAQGRVDVLVRTPTPLDAGTSELVTRRLEALLGKQVNLAVQEDESLIGGLVIRVGDMVYDASVANELNRLRESAVDTVVHAVRKSLDRFAPPKSNA